MATLPLDAVIPRWQRPFVPTSDAIGRILGATNQRYGALAPIGEYGLYVD